MTMLIRTSLSLALQGWGNQCLQYTSCSYLALREGKTVVFCHLVTNTTYVFDTRQNRAFTTTAPYDADPYLNEKAPSTCTMQELNELGNGMGVEMVAEWVVDWGVKLGWNGQ